MPVPLPILALVAVTLAAAAVRVLAANNELFVDEVWSVIHIHRVHAFTDILSTPHDNNHPLNTALIWWIGPGAAPWMYRVHSVAASVASVPLAAAAGLALADSLGLAPRARRSTALLSALMMAGCSLLIAVTTEARGYGMAVAFCLLALWALLRGVREQPDRWRWLCLWNAAITLALLAHLTALYLLVAGVAWHATRFVRGPDRKRHALAALRFHALPVLAALVLYWSFVDGMKIAGGSDWTYAGVLARFMRLTLGLPEVVPDYACLVLLVGGIIAPLWIAARCNREVALFFATGIAFAPALLLTVRPPLFLSERYFAVNGLLWLVLCAGVLGHALALSRAGKVGVLLLLAGVGTGNAVDVASLIDRGRGRCLPLLSKVARPDPQQQSAARTLVAVDHDMRVGLVAAYYLSLLKADHVAVIPVRAVAGAPPPWLLTHAVSADTSKAPPLLRFGEATYRLERSAPASRLSGLHWRLYRRVHARRRAAARPRFRRRTSAGPS
jgi:hypothetical protein